VEAFVERYNAWIDDLLNDPAERRRHPTAKRLRDLDAHQKTIYERILKTSQARAQIGYCEATITLQDGIEFYRFPGNFRRFLRFERRADTDVNASRISGVSGMGNPNNVMETMGTVAPWEYGRGVILMTQQRGFRVKPVPTLTEDQVWTLCYQKGPIHPHYATFESDAENVGPSFLRIPASVSADQGTVVRWPDYYVGEVLRILDASAGAGQFIEVSAYNPKNGQCTLRHDFRPTPSGTIKYEFGSFLPEGLDKIVAVSVALANTAVADRTEQRSLLTKEWKELYAACSHYFNSATADRPHSANPTYMDATVDPMAI